MTTWETNIENMFGQATDAHYEEGIEWYSATNTFAHGLSDKYGISVRQAAGIIAAISPRVRWDKNVLWADLFCKTGDAPIMYLSKDKARRILDGEDPDVVFAPKSRNSGQKVRSFFNCIIDPGCDDVCIDRHAYDIAVGSKGTDSLRQPLNRVGVYDNIRDAYRAVANKIGLIPNQLQAVTWVAWREIGY
jgi:hypothetical protein